MDYHEDIAFHKHFGYGSILSLIIFLLGCQILVLFLKGQVSFGNLLMLLSLILYIINNIFLNIFNLKSHFNDFLENLAVFLTFGISTVVFGILHFLDNLLLLVVVFIYAVCMVLSLSRNRISHLSNSVGWPVALNGLFFPLVYYTYEFYLFDMGMAVFLLFYIITAILMVSRHDFLGARIRNNFNSEGKRIIKITKETRLGGDNPDSE